MSQIRIVSRDKINEPMKLDLHNLKVIDLELFPV